MANNELLPTPHGMVVRALYNWDAENDPTCLGFHEGDIIQVISRARSGWWDGHLNGVRGWFPSNYIELFNDKETRSSKL
jgi:son of sevenless